MRVALAVLCLMIAVTGCAVVVSDHPRGGPVVVSPPPDPPAPAVPRAVVARPRSIKVPPGHYPPPGQCRVWHPGRPPGHQPPPVPCDRVVAEPGTFVLYNGKAWDGDYDWRGHARRHPGSVPHVIVEISARIGR